MEACYQHRIKKKIIYISFARFAGFYLGLYNLQVYIWQFWEKKKDINNSQLQEKKWDKKFFSFVFQCEILKQKDFFL